MLCSYVPFFGDVVEKVLVYGVMAVPSSFRPLCGWLSQHVIMGPDH